MRYHLRAATIVALTVGTIGCSTEQTATTDGFAQSIGHFDPKGKAPSSFTLEIFEEARATLPFDDTQDFDEQQRGFIGAPESMQIMADAGNVAWDMERYQFLLDEEINSVHPSMLRISRLNLNFGLYEVIPGIYQVRGFDLANITFIRGDTGWIVFDPLTAAETARAAKELVDEHLGELPVVAVVYSHSHGDHWGGVRGIVDEADVVSGAVEIIAPRDFMEYAISENIYAGNAMSRRMFYQYGVLLPASQYGHAGQGLSQNTAAGDLGLIPPSRIVEDDIEEFEVDGVRMIFENTPGTEAPSEMNTYIPEMRALWMAENVVGSVHNIYTLRGAQVRDALRWSKYINKALYDYGQEAEVMFASHHWPRWGNDRVQEVLRDQRDIYAHMNNQVLHYVNQGVTINEIHNVYRAPASLQEGWTTRFWHGSQENNSRGIVNYYLGHWDANPATLIPLSPGESAPLYVEMMGGASNIMNRGRELHDEGEYRAASEILNKLVYAEPQNEAAKDLLADVYEQLGYQQENPGLRNAFLAGAFELRSGIPEGASPKTSGPDLIRAMTTGLFLDFLGIRMNSLLAEDFEFTINLRTPDNGEQYLIELSNATLTNIEGYQADDADLTITIDRADLEDVMTGAKSLAAQIQDGTAQVDGDVGVLDQLASTMVTFEIGFEILPGTGGLGAETDLNPFEVGNVAGSPE
ncbi:MAG: alkyl sulfatase dimerization domain-containing protein [Actinomycetota bacterium]|nr:MBL fold metallo-hydrolase [Gemmatimonadota bacterium]MDK1011525.1 alkyl sulfatase dimerization domain-containing protein [Actinomycetota bacterium]